MRRLLRSAALQIAGTALIASISGGVAAALIVRGLTT